MVPSVRAGCGVTSDVLDVLLTYQNQHRTRTGGTLRKAGRSAHFNELHKLNRERGVATFLGGGVATRKAAAGGRAAMAAHPMVRLVPRALLAEHTVVRLHQLVGSLQLGLLQPWHARQDHDTLLLQKAVRHLQTYMP